MFADSVPQLFMLHLSKLIFLRKSSERFWQENLQHEDAKNGLLE